ncbi:hypothetical protein J0X19_01135 [Hymenobacter sp. BT186]|uniref:Uncharacterized protein n=1 Tax=Hymenobacter telluris TaxID=2816474 RepID=A0A939ESI5_9BACT|nr:hypothetical protein [Hymenobacter telluris]MBO0356536.1 hypothetical protein [Hymenobacter telluris]MBW3372561.1 hypothetical protein [Hymenobacter norwichensis]
MRTSGVVRFQASVAFLAGLLLLTGASRGTVYSDLFIEPGQQFVLGGGQPGIFQVAARNVGQAAVEVRERAADGTVTNKGTLLPKQKTTLRFAAGSAAVLRNTTSTKANLNLRITGPTGLNMSTENTRK